MRPQTSRLTPAPRPNFQPRPQKEYNQLPFQAGRGVRVSAATLAGGNLPALGYVPPGQLNTTGASIYSALLNAGETPENALNVAKGLQNKSANQIRSVLSGAQGGAEAGAAFGSIGLALGCLFCIPLGAAIGAIAGALGGLFSSSSPPTDQPGRPARSQPHRQQPNEGDGMDEHGNPYFEGLEAVPGAIDFGYRLANQLGDYYNDIFSSSGPQGGPSSAAGTEGTSPAAQPYYDNPSTEVLPSVEPPAPQPWRGYAAGEPNYPLEIQPNAQPDLQNLLSRQPNGAGGGQPDIIPPGGQPQLLNDIDRLIHQTDDQIAKETQQDVNNTTPQAVEQEVDRIQRELNELKRLETIPASQRDIPSELQQKNTIKKRLKDLKDKAKKVIQKVTFCVQCDDEQDALLFFNGEGDGSSCTVIPGSQQGGSQDYGQMSQPNSETPGPPPPEGAAPAPTTQHDKPVYVNESAFSPSVRAAYDDFGAWSDQLDDDLNRIAISAFRDGQSGQPRLTDNPGGTADSLGEDDACGDLETCEEVYNQAYSYGQAAREF